jgi:shikimate kinase
MIFEKKDKIYLIGFMGSGKSTVGRKIARGLNYDFYDLDNYIESYSGQSVTSLFQTKGEAYFRDLETECLRHFDDKKNIVLATGGGTPCFDDNLKTMLANACCVYLKMGEGALFQRLHQAIPKRPLLLGKSEDELRDYIHETLLKREEFYMQSHIIIDGINISTTSLIGVLKHKLIPKL